MLKKFERAKLAKQTINKTVPDLLKHDLRAARGVAYAELLHFNTNHEFRRENLTSQSGSAQGSASADVSLVTAPAPAKKSISPSVYVIKSDTFDAVRTISSTIPKHLVSKSKICVLSMASALNPGGGVLHGSLAQEESLCMRSTLYASLDPSWYRIPDLACIYTPGVLVFRDGALANLKVENRFYCDVISVAALKSLDCIKVKVDSKDGRGTEVVYADERDKEVMVAKIRGRFDVAKETGVTHLVLGALGCGAYRNPPKEVAAMFKRVIQGDRRYKGVEGMVEVVFAIFDEGENLQTFREVFGDKKVVGVESVATIA